jgi:two-component system, NtrC family, response regulator AtoC
MEAMVPRPGAKRVLIAEDDPGERRSLEAFLRRLGLRVTSAEDGAVACSRLAEEEFDLVITDLRMPHADGFAVLRAAHAKSAAVPVVMLTGQGSMEDCVAALRAGAFHFLAKPFHLTALQSVVEEALARQVGDDDEVDLVRAATAGDGRAQVGLVGDSPRLRAVLESVAAVAPTESSVLLLGETGTGKEVVARLLHGLSPRSGAPFVAVNCGAIPEGLVESELFGHARGAFTGAVERRVGRFVQASGGTLFLDEVGELPLAVQVKLLRVLEEREVTPVGDTRACRVDLRIIAATHRDLEALIRAGRFREDLYYRLSVIPIEIPPLRERGGDIALLARHFLDDAARRYRREVTLGEDALRLLAAYAWPGNVRELANLMEKLAVLARGPLIAASDLPARLQGRAAPESRIAVEMGEEGIDLVACLARAEEELIDEAMRRAEGNKNRAAALLGIKRTTLVEKLKRRSRG